jgi:hypothetical protein
MRYACLVWLIAGCGFAASPSTDPGGDPGGGPGPGGGSGGPGGSGTASGKCDVTDPGLRLCVSFGVDPMAQDLVTPLHELAAGSTGVVALTELVLPLPGLVAHTGGRFTATSQLRFKEHPDFDVENLTIDLWMLPQGTPADGNAFTLLDNNTEYSASYDAGGVHCTVAGTTVDSRPIAGPGWHHIACSYGKADRQLRVYVDGDLGGCRMAAAIPQRAMDGVAIGAAYDPKNGFQDRFLGDLGNVHLYATELTPDQICRAAGRPGDCNLACPEGDGGGGGGADPGGSL